MDIAECSTLPYENIPASGLLGDEYSYNTYVSRDAEESCHLVAPFVLNKRIHPSELLEKVTKIIEKILLYEFCDPFTLFDS